jgi:hypothetical protein
MTFLKPLAPYEIRDINREIQERLSTLTPMKSLVVVKSCKKRKCYGIGYNKQGDLILRNFQRMLKDCFKIYGAVNTTSAVLDLTGATKYISFYTGSDDTFLAKVYTGGGTRLAFGNPATTPTPARTDYELASLVARFNPSLVQSDEVNWRVTITGSYVWTAGGTVRETGLSIAGNDTSKVALEFLIYHDAVSDVSVPAGGTVSVTYTTQF